MNDTTTHQMGGDTDGAAAVTAIIEGLDDWRGATLARVRELIHEVDPDVVEETKWAKKTNPAGVPVWSHDGIVCTGEVYKANVKLTFFAGAALADPTGLFTSSLDGNTRRAIDLAEDADLDADAFRSLIRAAVAHNTGT
jgi:hypothetical protein